MIQGNSFWMWLSSSNLCIDNYFQTIYLFNDHLGFRHVCMKYIDTSRMN